MKKHLCEVNQCTGCGACEFSCPQHAICSKENPIGFYYPQIDNDKCIDCGLCDRICPSLNRGKQNSISKVYIGWRKDIGAHVGCASGGIASLIAKDVVSRNGIVYACMFDEGRVKIASISQLDQIERIKGSRYVQADVSGVIEEITGSLKQEREVLVIGTPCFIAGVRRSVNQNTDKLYLIDLVCHGVASQKLLFEHLKNKGIALKDIKNVTFRNQDGYYLRVEDLKGNIIYNRDCFHDLFFSGYNDSVYVRDSCVQCLYANQNRIGDLTLGDFHKQQGTITIEGYTSQYPSMILLNTGNGERLFERISPLLNYEESSVQAAIESNPHLMHPTSRRGDYRMFLDLYNKKGFESAAKRTLVFRRMKNMLINIVRK